MTEGKGEKSNANKKSTVKTSPGNGKQVSKSRGNSDKKDNDRQASIPKVEAEIVEATGLKEKAPEEASSLESMYLTHLPYVTMSIQKEVGSISRSFCRIGYCLLVARERRLYLEHGFRNVYEYAESALGFRRSSTGNYINVCERFSKRTSDGCPTSELMDEYKAFSFTQLSEVLSLPEGMEKEVTPDMTAKQIRKLKAGAGQEVSPGSVADDSFLSRSREMRHPPVCIWERVVDQKNLEALIKIIRENTGKGIAVYVAPEGGAE